MKFITIKNTAYNVRKIITLRVDDNRKCIDIFLTRCITRYIFYDSSEEARKDYERILKELNEEKNENNIAL
jgi:hypothetical protein